MTVNRKTVILMNMTGTVLRVNVYNCTFGLKYCGASTKFYRFSCAQCLNTQPRVDAKPKPPFRIFIHGMKFDD